MTSLFFLWGFMTVFNDILIPRFKEGFALSHFQTVLVQLAEPLRGITYYWDCYDSSSDFSGA
jgi:hypothetical protein